MADEWHYAKDGNQLGPVSASELKQLAASGTLGPADLVWNEGMSAWKPASSVEGLISTGEKTDSIVESPLSTKPNMDAGSIIRVVQEKVLHVWKSNKLAFFGFGFPGLTIFLCGINGAMMASDFQIRGFWSFIGMFFGLLVMLVWFGFLIGFIVTGIMWINTRLEASTRKDSIRSKWEPVNGDASWIVFFDDGGFLRSDGYSAKYEYDSKADVITITSMQLDEPVSISIVTLSDHELVLWADGQTIHYRKGQTITSEERRKSLDAFSKKWGDRAKTAAAVAGVATAGTVAAVGAVAVLGAVGVVGAAAASVPPPIYLVRE